MKTLLLGSMLALISLATYAQSSESGSGPGNSSTSSLGLAFPTKIKELPLGTNRTNFYRAVGDSTAVADVLMLHTDVPGPYILRLCVAKSSANLEGIITTPIFDYSVGKKEIIHGNVADLKNTEKNSDFTFCHDTEYPNSAALNGKNIRIVATGHGRDYFLQTFPKNKPSLTWPVLIQTGKFQEDISETYINVEIFNSLKQ